MSSNRFGIDGPKIATIQIYRAIGSADVWNGPARSIHIGLPSVDFIPVPVGCTTKCTGDPLQIEAEFVEVTSDNGERGIFGPVSPNISSYILERLRSILVGRRVLAYEDCWEAAFIGERHGRGGHYITALGAVDCALWDLRGRILDLPVFELLGGPTRQNIPCYASLLGYDPDSEEAEDLAIAVRDMGFVGQKWALRDGPEEGEKGLVHNVARVAKLRRAVGKHHSLMFDAFGKWTLGYTQTVLKSIQDYAVMCIEEPVSSREELAYQRLSRMMLAPIAAGEHLYTRFEVARFLSDSRLDILQPDIAWCGGITEAVKITILASVYGIPVFPHGGSFVPALHMAMSRSSAALPAVEYHMTIEPKRQFFLAQKFKPIDGMIPIPSSPGLGIHLDATRIKESHIGFIE